MNRHSGRTFQIAVVPNLEGIVKLCFILLLRRLVRRGIGDLLSIRTPGQLTYGCLRMRDLEGISSAYRQHPNLGVLLPVLGQKCDTIPLRRPACPGQFMRYT
jgi:hypothetical protein